MFAGVGGIGGSLILRQEWIDSGRKIHWKGVCDF